MGSLNFWQPAPGLVHFEEPWFVFDAKPLARACTFPLRVLYRRLGNRRCLHVLVLNCLRELGP